MFRFVNAFLLFLKKESFHMMYFVLKQNFQSDYTKKHL